MLYSVGLDYWNRSMDHTIHNRNGPDAANRGGRNIITTLGIFTATVMLVWGAYFGFMAYDRARTLEMYVARQKAVLFLFYEILKDTEKNSGRYVIEQLKNHIKSLATKPPDKKTELHEAALKDNNLAGYGNTIVYVESTPVFISGELRRFTSIKNNGLSVDNTLDDLSSSIIDALDSSDLKKFTETRFINIEGRQYIATSGKYRMNREDMTAILYADVNEVLNSYHYNDRKIILFIFCFVTSALFATAGRMLVRSMGRERSHLEMLRKTADDLADEVDERMRAQQILSESEERYRLLMERSPDGIMIADIESRRFLFTNPAACELFGYSEEECKELKIEMLHPAEDREYAMSIFFNVMEADERYDINSIRCEKSNGDIFRADIRIAKTTINARACLIGIIRDITERHRYEKAIIEAEEKLATILNSASEIIFTKDEEKKYVFANRACESFHNMTLDGIIGRTDSEIMGREDAERNSRQDDRALGGETVEDVSTFQSSGGNRRTCHTIKFPLRNRDGRIYGLGGITRDITHIKEAEDERAAMREQILQMQKMEAIGHLAGGVAHDFNNMLSIIMGNADIALFNIHEGDEGYNELKSIVSACTRSRDLTMQLLSFARKEKLNVGIKSVNGILAGLTEIVNRSFMEDIRIETDVDESINLKCDPNQVTQALLNICNNSRDAMPGGGTISISASRITADEKDVVSMSGISPGDYCRIIIEDTGKGIPEDVIPKVFDPFFTTKDMGKGTGLGLSTTQRIIMNHGGHIEISSEPGAGTSVSIYLPLSDDKPAVDHPEIKETILPGVETILAVDDEMQLLETVAKSLSNAGYTVFKANGGREAIDIYSRRRGEIDIVLLDMIMPEISGREVFEKLQALDPGVKVIILSGYSEEGEAGEMLDAGACCYVQKPFRFAEITTAIRGIMDRNPS